MPGLSIPSRSRVLVRARDLHRCVVCGMRGTNWHHRRSRSVRDACTHAPCNGVTMCGSGTTGCHEWVHAHPFEARAQGLIISKYEPLPPHEVPLLVAGRWVMFDCDGGITVITDPTV